MHLNEATKTPKKHIGYQIYKTKFNDALKQPGLTN